MSKNMYLNPLTVNPPKNYFLIKIYIFFNRPLAKVGRFEVKVPLNGLMHRNCTNFKEIYREHFSNLAYTFRMYI
jgi:hypothetical protein